MQVDISARTAVNASKTHFEARRKTCQREDAYIENRTTSRLTNDTLYLIAVYLFARTQQSLTIFE